MATFDRWNEELAATTRKPEPTEDGMVVHSYFDISMYSGTEEARRFNVAETDEDIADAARQMPLATVSFSQLPADEPFFDDPDADAVLPY